jgi:putative endonuclease
MNSSLNYIVYALKSVEKNYIYVGMTNDLSRRIKEHNDRRNRSTKAYAPFNLIYSEICKTRLIAREREKYLKSGIGKEFLRTLI